MEDLRSGEGGRVLRFDGTSVGLHAGARFRSHRFQSAPPRILLFSV